MSKNNVVDLPSVPDVSPDYPTFTPGQRVNFAGDDLIAAMLKQGYLELEILATGNTCYHLVTWPRGENIRYGFRQATSLITQSPAEFRRIGDLRARFDLHAFRWYPFSLD